MFKFDGSCWNMVNHFFSDKPAGRFFMMVGCSGKLNNENSVLEKELLPGIELADNLWESFKNTIVISTYVAYNGNRMTGGIASDYLSQRGDSGAVIYNGSGRLIGIHIGKVKI